MKNVNDDPISTEKAAHRLRGDDRLWAGRSGVERLLLAAIIFSPLQRALTLDVGGFPVKISELLVVLALLGLVLGVRRAKVPWSTGLRLALSLMFISLAVSTIFALFEQVDFPYIGINRSLDVDALIYAAYGGLVLFMWAALRPISLDAMVRALVVAVVIAGIFTLIQDVGLRTGQVGILEALNIDTRQRGVALGASIGGRSGPFTEGQQLGFFAAVGMLAALWRRSYVVAAIAAYCVIYSQATTGFLALAAAIVISVVARPSANATVRLAGVALAAAVAASFVPAIQTWVGHQFQKLGLLGADSPVTSSLDIRTMKSEVGFEILLNQPLTGVGPGRYGVWFFPFSENREVPDYYFSGTARVIAENAYAQIGAEMGAVGLAGFVILLLVLLVGNWKSSIWAAALTAAVAVGVATQSSWTFFPIWMSLAIAAAAMRDTRLALTKTGNEASTVGAMSVG